MEMSKHLQTERLDRCAFILATIGLGEVVHCYKQPIAKANAEGAWVKITSTGIAMVVDGNDKLITMYVLTVKEAEKYFDNKIPLILKSILINNMRKKYHLLQNETKY